MGRRYPRDLEGVHAAFLHFSDGAAHDVLRGSDRMLPNITIRRCQRARQSATGTTVPTRLTMVLNIKAPDITIDASNWLRPTEGKLAIEFERRRFMALLGGAMAIWPNPSRAQQSGRVRTIGVLMGLADDAESQVRLKAFEQGLEKEGWTPSQDVRIEYRFGAGDAKRIRTFAKELVELQPDILLGHSTPVVRELVKNTRKIPIVFVVVADPVGSGFVASIPRPGGNATGFTNLDATITGKLLTILKQITPNLTRVALMLNPDTGVSGGLFYLSPFEVAAPSFGVEAIPVQVSVPADIERHMTELARAPNVGLIVMPDNFLTVHRHLIISLAARLRIPTVYPYRYFVESGGLMSYGVDVTDLFRRAPEYVSRILRGANPADLPVQAPTKFELVINLRTARNLGLAVPRILLAGADALIE
jgi:putative ABC transport system substrate-binding protein